MRTIFIVVLTSLLSVACSQSGNVRQDPTSHYYLPPVGTQVELMRSLSVPAQRTRVFLQGGKLTRGFNQYVPNCNFEVRRLSDQPQVISPENFLVVKVQRLTEEVVQLSKPVQVAGLGLAGMDSDASQSMIVRGVHLWFGSDTQPDVMRLTCRGGFDDPWRADPPSIDEMRAVLGDYARIVLP